jgi:hypothetical protein
MAETRKLAAILAADVAGYSKLAAADEERTLARLRALRSDLIDPTIAVPTSSVLARSRRQLDEQSPGLLQIERVEPFGEPAVDRGEKIAGFIPLA